jgi:hypothetical protein
VLAQTRFFARLHLSTNSIAIAKLQLFGQLLQIQSFICVHESNSTSGLLTVPTICSALFKQLDII